MNQPLLHVMIPAYGESPFLNETLNSIPTDYFEFAKFTVVEDPSNFRNIFNIMKKYPKINYLINEKRLGIAGNFNKCLEISEGKYTQICGSDDKFSSNINFKKLHQKLLLEKNIDIIINSVEVIDENGNKKITLIDFVKEKIKPKIEGKISCRDFMESIAIGDWAYFPSIYWKTSTFKKIKFSNQFHTAMDLEIFYQACEKNLEIYLHNSKTLLYRRHKRSASVTYANDPKRFEEEFKCQEFGKKIAHKFGWNKVEFYLILSLGIRFHILIKLLNSVLSDPNKSLTYLKLFFKRLK